MNSLLKQALRSGLMVSVATSGVLALAALSRGRGAAQPVNATSHWLQGDRAGAHRGIDVSHTLLGYMTHWGASAFWAFLYEVWRVYEPGRSRVSRAAATSVVAAFIDYLVVPKRLTPGWELVLPKRDIALTYVVMAMALAACDRAQARRLRERHAHRG